MIYKKPYPPCAFNWKKCTNSYNLILSFFGQFNFLGIRPSANDRILIKNHIFRFVYLNLFLRNGFFWSIERKSITLSWNFYATMLLSKTFFFVLKSVCIWSLAVWIRNTAKFLFNDFFLESPIYYIGKIKLLFIICCKNNWILIFQSLSWQVK